MMPIASPGTCHSFITEATNGSRPASARALPRGGATAWAATARTASVARKTGNQRIGNRSMGVFPRSEVRVIEPLDVRQRQAPQVGVGSAFDRIGRAGRRIERQIESVDVPKVVALEEQLSRALRNQIGPHAVRVDRTTVRW